ncbi:thiol:disulfide interchange signal peptide protein [Herbaspirillum sp. BH-1]|uniref:Thiol:disulfide interchange protein DsbA n=1 Tax=Herbaspirillum frisingense TaxID=92645 RepID=A0ABU1PFB3_9BURK|nr:MULTISPECIES: thiol:disulfide interchange protein DsbA/DsbL [Herbaspirillum]MDR6584410.1 thiol:disulfide interchange protein DsbA [Herbaspirillum frisingense]PLY59655.1 thiol:disulfide interchange signal peptide protein [Herbaspirillum sp. BH-1]QNB09379.1 thiol:disulfide interchange protein DsbA/DsbL [Herbaspirillum frisingense]UIN21080.1 thiol:disulfide interchange protein DsbA/DsbL [Herbaspirillum frisingense]
MRFHQKLLAAVSFGVLAFTASVGASASPANPQVGSDYRVLEQAQPTDSGNKVEVTEFFWFDCPHCAAWDPSLTAWVKKQGDKINFKKVPVAFRDSFVPQQKLYYTLEAMGKADELTPKIFHAIHVENQRINTDKTILAYIEKIGLDKQKFLDLYNSFGVQTKARRAAQLQEAYKVDGVPMIAIDGRYVTSPAVVGVALANQPESMQQAAALQVMDHLVAKVAAEKAAGGAAAKKK